MPNYLRNVVSTGNEDTRFIPPDEFSSEDVAASTLLDLVQNDIPQADLYDYDTAF